MKNINLIYISLLFFTWQSWALANTNILRSSISPEFPHGLHAKYLTLIATEMELELSIIPMPYARRILALRNGQIDIMVGFRERIDTNNEIVYISPHYEELKTAIYVLAKNHHKYQSNEDLNGLTMGTTIGYKPDIRSNLINSVGLNLVRVTSLEQKIEMLLKERTDMFTHFEQSTLPMLKQKGLVDKVVLANIQFPFTTKYYVALSTKSDFFVHKEKLSKAINRLIQKGAFRAVRDAHYSRSNVIQNTEKSHADNTP